MLCVVHHPTLSARTCTNIHAWTHTQAFNHTHTNTHSCTYTQGVVVPHIPCVAAHSGIPLGCGAHSGGSAQQHQPRPAVYRSWVARYLLPVGSMYTVYPTSPEICIDPWHQPRPAVYYSWAACYVLLVSLDSISMCT
jgi:hypothetical protein